MAYEFSAESEQKLATCHTKLQEILRAAIELCDFTILEGQRGEAAQNAAFAAGKSKLKFPHSKHNSSPSNAVDIAPFPVDWAGRERFAFLAGIVLGIATQKKIALRWGGDWNGDGELANNKFDDLPHFELIDP